MSMVDFKKFLGLGNIQSKIEKIPVGGAFTTTDYTKPSPEGYGGDEDFMTKLSNTVYELPSIEKTGKIDVLLMKKNPIFVKLDNGTEAFFSYDEFQNIRGNRPALGKTMKIVFQRSPNDNTNNTSKIDYAEILD